jgi:HAD domain in Swiss Army Knife RNA repair proteins
MGAKESAETSSRRSLEPSKPARKPLLLVDVDGVISLFGSPAPWLKDAARERAIEGSLHTIEGIPHFLSRSAAAHLRELAADFELVWASGWEEKADEHLPHLLGLPAGLPHLRFGRATRGRAPSEAHWKLSAIADYAGARALAWIDDAFNDACHVWARQRRAPTLLVQTSPERGLTSREALLLREWAREPPAARR